MSVNNRPVGVVVVGTAAVVAATGTGAVVAAVCIFHSKFIFIYEKSSQVKLPLIKTSDNRASFTSKVNENKS